MPDCQAGCGNWTLCSASTKKDRCSPKFRYQIGNVIRTCTSCGAENRIPWGRLSDQAKCGNCKNALPALAQPVDVEPGNFDAIIQGAKVPILIDFWAPWCGPCRMAAPHVKQAAAQLAGRALVLKANTEDFPALGSRFGVQAIPHFVVLQNGRKLREQSGLMNASQLVGLLQS